MVAAITIFLLTALITFSTSFQSGPVSVNVMRAALQNKSAALAVAMGGSIAELIFAGLAVFTAEMLYPIVTDWDPMAIIGPLFMVGFGVYLLISANRKFLKGRKASIRRGVPFVIGLQQGLLNPQIYLFYCGILLSYFQFGFRPDEWLHRVIAFSTGAGVGFFSFLLLIIYIVNRRGKINNHYFRGSKVIYACAGVLIITGLYQLISQF
jgi:threonine/homoserine/homoserine lactone efflux protein